MVSPFPAIVSPPSYEGATKGTARHFRVATFDLLGQGASDKPELFISQDDQVAAPRLLIDELGDGPVQLAHLALPCPTGPATLSLSFCLIRCTCRQHLVVA